MSILVIADHNNQTLNGATLNVVAAAQKIGGDITVLVAGSGAQAVADAAAKVAGVSKVLLADNAAYANQLAETQSNHRGTAWQQPRQGRTGTVRAWLWPYAGQRDPACAPVLHGGVRSD